MEGNRALRIGRVADPSAPSVHHWLAGVAELLSAVGGAVALADDAGQLLAMSRRLEDAVGELSEPARHRWLADLRDAICAHRSGDECNERHELISPWQTRLAAVSFPSPGHTVVRIELPRTIHLPDELRVVLSPREAEVAARLLEGHSSRQIGEYMGITVHTVRRMTERVFKKTGTHSRAEFTLRALGVVNRPRLNVIKEPDSRRRSGNRSE